MIMADKQFSSQTTFLSTSWNVLSNNIQDRFINDWIFHENRQGFQGFSTSVPTEIDAGSKDF